MLINENSIIEKLTQTQFQCIMQSQVYEKWANEGRSGKAQMQVKIWPLESKFCQNWRSTLAYLIMLRAF